MLASFMKQANPPLSKNCKEIILGSMLGDGSLKIHKPYVNARFSFRHSVKQKEYFEWKINQLAEISGESCVWLQQDKNGRDGWGGPKLRYQSLARPSLTEIFLLTNKGGKMRIRRKWLNQLTPLSLAIWWFDDGSLVSDSRQGVFCTDGFSLQEVRILNRYLKIVWNVSTTIGQVGKTEKYRLWLRSTTELQKFLRIILPHVRVQAVLYKTLLLFKDSHLQQRWISEVTTGTGFSSETVEEIVRERKASLKNFRE